MSKAQQRLSQVQSHLASSEADIPRGRESILSKSPDDIVITCALRTPFTKGGKGGLKDIPAADLLVHAFKSLLARSKLDPSLVEDIAVGSVLPPGGGATEFRAAALVAGFPESTAVKSLNRQCSSGLQACCDIASAIRWVRTSPIYSSHFFTRKGVLRHSPGPEPSSYSRDSFHNLDSLAWGSSADSEMCVGHDRHRHWLWC